MAALKSNVVTRTLDEVQVVYIDRTTTKWWNARRKENDTAIFTGWYWIHGGNESGPYKTRSAAIRDAYYRFVLEREQPMIAQAKDKATQRKDIKSKPIKFSKAARASWAS